MLILTHKTTEYNFYLQSLVMFSRAEINVTVVNPKQIMQRLLQRLNHLRTKLSESLLHNLGDVSDTQQNTPSNNRRRRRRKCEALVSVRQAPM